MSHFSYERFHHDMWWGYRLWTLQQQHRATGFRGSKKGKGFQAYLTANKISRRQAYRLIERFMKINAIMDAVIVSNEALEKKSLNELEAVIERGISDADAVTNGGSL